MNVTKAQIINGIVRYAKSEIIDKITDKPLKMILATGVSMLEVNNSILDSVFNNDFIAKILSENGGMYDIDSAIEAIENTMDEYGDFPVTIPAIKFISPVEKQLTFTAKDVKKLKEYIVGGAV